jgi:hypothetical protein
MLDSLKTRGDGDKGCPDHHVRQKQFQILPADRVRIGSALREAQNRRNATHASQQEIARAYGSTRVLPSDLTI